MTVELMSARQDISRQLAQAGVASPDADARWLLEFATETGTDLEDSVRRRAAREPLQHITGRAPYRYLDLRVGSGVFIPRPETELLVDAALAALDNAALINTALPHDKTLPIVVDLCAGSGAIGLAIAAELNSAGRNFKAVHLVEISDEAMPWLAINAAAINDDRVLIHHGDLHAAPCGAEGTVDVVVSNPPYLPLGTEIEPEVAADPELALWGGADGLDVIRRVIDRAAELLKPGGSLIVEHDVCHDLSQLLSGWDDVLRHDDLTKRPRFTTAMKRQA